MKSSTGPILPKPSLGKTGWPWTIQDEDFSQNSSNEFQWPRVTVVTPSFNQHQFLEETIRSVLLQDYPNLEYIIMDGGSTDGSRKIIEKYQDHLAYWISDPDNGQCDAINRGFGRATGDILAWLNSDDTYQPGALRAVARTFASNPDKQLVYGEGWYMDASSARMRPCRFVREVFRDVYMVNKDPILQQGAFWTRDLWNKVGPLDESLNWVFDWDWFIRARLQTKFHYIPRFLANYRVHPDAKTRSSDIQRRRELALITRRYGKWWHPNYLVQKAHILAHHATHVSQNWPRAFSSPVRTISNLSIELAKIVFYDLYTS